MPRWDVFAVGWAALAALACQGNVLPLSAQQGSTVLIPLTGDPAQGVVGYGGTLREDYQRGTLVYQLDGPGGDELVTRASTAVLPAPNAEIASGLMPQRLHVSLVDIPLDAPEGAHSLHVVRRRIEGGTAVDHQDAPPYKGELTILPQQVDVDGPPFVSEGAPTPLARWACQPAPCGFKSITNAHIAIPFPELRVTFSAFVSAAEVRFEYPSDVIDVFDAFEPPQGASTHLATVWHQDDPGNEVVRVGAVAPLAPFRMLSLAFSLDDGASEILDPADVNVVVERAWDAQGELVPVSVVEKKIY
jgi:hypothetical protein